MKIILNREAILIIKSLKNNQNKINNNKRILKRTKEFYKIIIIYKVYLILIKLNSLQNHKKIKISMNLNQKYEKNKKQKNIYLKKLNLLILVLLLITAINKLKKFTILDKKLEILIFQIKILNVMMMNILKN